jgi:NDP-sugar pyrophosphorylase family protein
MRAVILAGGKGVRLAPLTQVIPKPLVPLGGKPILEIVLNQLRSQGFRRITLAVGYMADLIQAYFGDGSRLDLDLDYSFETQPLGTAGPLAFIDGLNETFLVMNADVLTDLNYQDLVAFHRQTGAIATVSAYERQVQIDLGVIIKDGDTRILDYVEKPAYTHLVSMGVYVFEPAILDFIRNAQAGVNPSSAGWQPLSGGNGQKPPGYLDFPDLVKYLLSCNQPVHFYPFTGYWLDIGRHEDYAKANEEFLNLQPGLASTLAASPDAQT